jgi:LysM repeat protein
MMRLALPIALLLTLAAPVRANRYVTYVVRPTDTAESIAAEFYGNRARAYFITEFNGLPRGARLKPGQTIRIPTSYRYRLNAGEALPDVAQRLVGDRRRAPLLLELSDLRPTDRIGPGTEIQLPFHFVHTTRPGETLTSIAKAYYGDPAQARLLALYNFRKGINQAPLPGERLVIPITHVRVRAVRLPNPRPQRRLPPQVVSPKVPESEPDPQKLEAELAAQVRSRVRDAERAYNEGNYTDVPAALIKLLTEVDPSEAQLVEIYRLLAFAYVALGETELAVKALREVLDRQPDFQFDPVQTSPKIRNALELARAGQ